MVKTMVKTMSLIHETEQLTHSITPAKNGTIACTICSALYAPSHAHAYLIEAPSIALDSAFMSMCRFCFRCRRPACPLCWDDVHSLCGTCVAEVHLPFRKEVEPLPLNSALLVPLSSHPKPRYAASFPLVCLRSGSFHTETSQKEVMSLSKLDSVVSPAPTEQKQEMFPVQDAEISIDEQEHKTLVPRHIERVLTVLLGLILFVITVLIVVAFFSVQANTVIAHVLHVDIRMEIEYLLQLIQQINI